jgi:hypothetical protein
MSSANVPNIGKRYVSSLNANKVAGDWNLVDATSLVAATEVQIGKFTVPAGLRVQIGGGYAYVVMQTSTPARIEGLMRIYINNAQGSTRIKVAEFHSTQCQTLGNKYLSPWIDLAPYVAQKDSYFTLVIIADATATDSQANSIAIVPCMKYDVAQM